MATLTKQMIVMKNKGFNPFSFRKGYKGWDRAEANVPIIHDIPIPVPRTL